MALDHHQLFEKLLEQLQLTEPDQLAAFRSATLDKLTVHEKSKRWHFDLSMPDVLPYDIFLTFHHQLETTFKTIAQVAFSIRTTQPQLTDRALGDYWEWVVQNSGLTSPLVQELCHKQVPHLEDGRVIFMAENEVVKNFLVNQALGPIEQKYRQIGFPAFSIHTLVDESASQQKKLKNLRLTKPKMMLS